MALKNNFQIEARKNKNDEFYTQYEDIASEVEKFRSSFNGKTVYCPCDGGQSNFPKYFKNNYKELGLTGLYWSSHSEACYYYDGNKVNRVYNPVDITTFDFHEWLDKCDIVCTNPPFSLFNEFINDIIDKGKDFLIVGPQHALTYKNVFKHIVTKKIVPDYGFKGLAGYFFVPVYYTDYATSKSHTDGMIRVPGVMWYSSLPNETETPMLNLTKSYKENPEHYPFYDNFKTISGLNEECINIDKVSDIPFDYDGYMGVPISFMNKYNPEQFEIIQLDHYGPLGNLDNVVNGKQLYRRIYIKKLDKQV